MSDKGRVYIPIQDNIDFLEGYELPYATEHHKKLLSQSDIFPETEIGPYFYTEQKGNGLNISDVKQTILDIISQSSLKTNQKKMQFCSIVADYMIRNPAYLEKVAEEIPALSVLPLIDNNAAAKDVKEKIVRTLANQAGKVKETFGPLIDLMGKDNNNALYHFLCEILIDFEFQLGGFTRGVAWISITNCDDGKGPVQTKVFASRNWLAFKRAYMLSTMADFSDLISKYEDQGFPRKGPAIPAGSFARFDKERLAVQKRIDAINKSNGTFVPASLALGK